MRSQRGKIKYNSKWEQEFTWLTLVTTDLYRAKCKVCNKHFAIDSMGRSAVVSHSKGKDHLSRIKVQNSTPPLMYSFASTSVVPDFTSAASTSALPASASTASTSVSTASTSAIHASTSFALDSSVVSTYASSQDTCKISIGQETSVGESVSILSMPVNKKSESSPFQSPDIQQSHLHTVEGSGLKRMLTKDSVTKAEAYWCLSTVLNHSSLRSAERNCSLFKKMFPTCEIANSMQLHRTKIAYSIVYGLAPYFKNELEGLLKTCSKITLGFDESLNKVAQSQQMDVAVRFWDCNTNTVCTRYLTSVFLKHSTSECLLQGIKEALIGIPLNKIMQLSMDGPNVNLKLQKLLNSELSSCEVDGPKLLDIGSCGLHTLHNAFKVGLKGTEWNLNEFLRALYYLFKDSPARRGDYIQVTGSSVFPLKFCNVRWLENDIVVSRALQVLPCIEKYVKTVEGTPMEPKCNSFKTVVSSLKDRLLLAKLTFFQSLSKEVEPFLREFQTDSPMVPFLFETLSDLVRNIMTRIVRAEVMSSNFLKIDIGKKETLMLSKDIDVGFATRSALKKCKGATEKDILVFKNDCRTFLKLFIQKCMERSPLKYSFTESVSCLSPHISASDKGNTRLRQTLETLVSRNVMEGNVADKIQREYTDLCSRESVKYQMIHYSRSDIRLDKFWMEVLEHKVEYRNLENFVKLILIMSHGNSNLERGFSVNRECLVENLKEQSLVAQRMIHDSVTVKGGLDNIEITKSVVFAMRNANGKYKEALEKQRQEKDSEEQKQDKRKRMALEIRQLEIKKRKLIEEKEKALNEISAKINMLKN